MKNIKFLAIGGCHVSGYGLSNQENSFVNMLISAVNSDDITFEKKAHDYVSLKKFFQETDHIHEFAPDILLIQLGNYEFTFGVKQELLSFLKLKKRKAVKATNATNAGTSPKARMISKSAYIKVLVMSWFKVAIDALVSVTKKKMQVSQAELRQVMEILDQLNYNIILLSPFPVLDEFIQKTRMSAHKTLKNHEFKNKKIRYINTNTLVPRKRTYFQDPGHLNEEGHSRMAHKLQSVFNELCGINQSETVTM